MTPYHPLALRRWKKPGMNQPMNPSGTGIIQITVPILTKSNLDAHFMGNFLGIFPKNDSDSALFGFLCHIMTPCW